MGAAVLDAIVHGRISGHYAPAVTAAALENGLPESSLPDLFAGLASGVYEGVAGATAQVWDAALEAHRWQYAKAYGLAWASIIPFVVLALIAIWFMKGVKELMTEKIEATVEHVPNEDAEKKLAFHL